MQPQTKAAISNGFLLLSYLDSCWLCTTHTPSNLDSCWLCSTCRHTRNAEHRDTTRKQRFDTTLFTRCLLCQLMQVFVYLHLNLTNQDKKKEKKYFLPDHLCWSISLSPPCPPASHTRFWLWYTHWAAIDLLQGLFIPIPPLAFIWYIPS